MNTKTLELIRQKNSTLNSIKIFFQLLLSDHKILLSIFSLGLVPSMLVIVLTSVILGPNSQSWYLMFSLVYSVTNILVLNSILRNTFSFLEVDIETTKTSMVDLALYCLVAAAASLLPFLVETTFHPNVFLSALLIPIGIYVSFVIMNAFIELQVTGSRPEYDLWKVITKTNNRVYSGLRSSIGLGMLFMILSLPFFVVFAMGQQIEINRIISYLVGSLAGAFFPGLFMVDQIKHNYYLTNEQTI